jgi:hypothetical protein
VLVVAVEPTPDSEYVSNAVILDAAVAGVVGAGTTKFSGLTTMAAILFCMAQPAFEWDSLVGE